MNEADRDWEDSVNETLEWFDWLGVKPNNKEFYEIVRSTYAVKRCAKVFGPTPPLSR